MKHCLTIAGSDCSGGAGIQADLKTFSALGTFGMSVVTSVVAENTSRVISVCDVPADTIGDQIDAVFEDIRVDAVKIGMLSNVATARIVAGKLQQYQPANVVIDPVMVATSGGALMQEAALDVLVNEILPFADVLTPNIPEAAVLCGKPIQTQRDMEDAAKRIHSFGAKNVLIKGGHLTGDALDILYDGVRYYAFPGKRIPSNNTHGTGCTLSSAIAAFLAKGTKMEDAIAQAKEYVTAAIQYAYGDIGKGHGPTNHFYEFYNWKG